MRSQIEKNKEILCDEIEQLSEQKMTEAVANKLSVYCGAYNALCMMDGKEKEYAAAWMDHPDSASELKGDYIHTGTMQITKADVAAWVSAMENADGTHGGHWSMEQTESVRKKNGIECDPVMFYAAMNMMFSDYCKAAEKTGVTGADFYAYMAKAFLDDKDAAHNKLARYYHCVVDK